MISERPWNLKFLLTPKTLDCEDNRPGTSEVGWVYFFFLFLKIIFKLCGFFFFFLQLIPARKLKIWRKSIERNEKIFVSFMAFTQRTIIERGIFPLIWMSSEWLNHIVTHLSKKESIINK